MNQRIEISLDTDDEVLVGVQHYAGVDIGAEAVFKAWPKAKPIVRVSWRGNLDPVLKLGHGSNVNIWLCYLQCDLCKGLLS